MEGKHAILLAGGVAAVVGLGKMMTRDVDIPGWLALLVIVPVVGGIGYAVTSALNSNRRFEEDCRAKGLDPAAELKRLKEELDAYDNAIEGKSRRLHRSPDLFSPVAC